MSDALAAQRAGIEGLAGQRMALDPLVFDAIAHVRADIDAPDLVPPLPGDHPAWQRDIVSISARARALVAALRPLVVKVLSFWDHRFGDIAIGAKRLGVDASGSYRLY